MSVLTPKADIYGLAQNYTFNKWRDVRFWGQSGSNLGYAKESANSHKRTYQVAKDIKVYLPLLA